MVAIAWLLHQPTVSATIIGPRELAQFAATLPALDLKLDAEILAVIDEIFPPCGAAPEAYAW